MDDANNRDRLMAHARSEMELWSQGDTVGYGEAAAADITYFHNAPAGSRVDGAEAFRQLLTDLQGQIPPHDYEMIQPRVQIYGEVGVFSLVYLAKTPDGQVLARVRGTSVYREAGGGWEMVHSHWSNMEDPTA